VAYFLGHPVYSVYMSVFNVYNSVKYDVIWSTFDEVIADIKRVYFLWFTVYVFYVSVFCL